MKQWRRPAAAAAAVADVPVSFQKELISQQPTNVFELEVKKSYQRVLGRRREAMETPAAAAAVADVPVRFQKELISQQPTNFFELEVKKSYQRVLGRRREAMETPAAAAAAAAEVPVRFQKELISQQPTNFFELEVKKSYQRVLGRSLKRRIAEIDDEEEDMLRHVQLHQTYKLLRKYQVGQINFLVSLRFSP